LCRSAGEGAAYVTKVCFPESPALTEKKLNLCGDENSSVELMSPSVAVNAKRNQVFQSIMAELAPGIQVMNF